MSKKFIKKKFKLTFLIAITPTSEIFEHLKDFKIKLHIIYNE